MPDSHSFLLDLAGQSVFTPSVKDLEVSVPWLVISLLILWVDVPLVLSFQVSEVLSEEKSRLSISGWFHGPSLTRPPAYFEPPIPRSPHIPRDVRISACCRILILAAVAYQVFLWFQEWLFLIMKPDLELALPLCLDKLAGVLLGQFSSTLYLTRRQF